MRKLKFLAVLLIFVFALGTIAYADVPNSVLHYDFENDSGSTVMDTSGNNNHAEFVDYYGIGMMFIESPFGQGIQLDGAAQFMELPAGVFDRDALTLSFWVRWEGGMTWQRLFEIGSWIRGDHIMMVPRTGEDLFQFQGWNYDAQHSFVATPADEDWRFPQNEWVHIAITQDADTLTFVFVNGEPFPMNVAFWSDGDESSLENVTSFVTGVSFRYANNPPPAEGEDIFRRFGWAATSSWDATTAGSYDEIRVFSGVLTSGQIRGLYLYNDPYQAVYDDNGSGIPWIWIGNGIGGAVVLLLVFLIIKELGKKKLDQPVVS